MLMRHALKIAARSYRIQLVLGILCFCAAIPFVIFPMPVLMALPGAGWVAGGWWLCERAANAKYNKEHMYQIIEGLEEER